MLAAAKERFPEKNMSKYVLALDQGTTSSRALVFDATGRVVARATTPARPAIASDCSRK